ncbi:MAG: hypothetical protein QXL51_00980 [Candidatus Aenigmatarchaeota archaeon]
MNETKMKAVGIYEIKHFDKDGNLIEERTYKNVLTKAGFAAMAGLFGDVDSQSAFKYIAIGTGTTSESADDTALQSEITNGGGERALATVSRVTTTYTNDTCQLVTTFNFTSSFAVTESGVFNAASNGVMASRKTFSAINVTNGDSLQITWKIQFSA